MEINHPEFGWIPFTATPDDTVELGRTLYAEALEAGNIAAYVPPSAAELRTSQPPVTARQLRLTLVRNGKSLASVDAAIDALPDGQLKDEARVEWEYGTTFDRLSPALLTVAAALAISPEEIDTMWVEALAA